MVSKEVIQFSYLQFEWTNIPCKGEWKANLEKYIGWNPEKFHCPIGNLIKECLGHMVLA